MAHAPIGVLDHREIDLFALTLASPKLLGISTPAIFVITVAGARFFSIGSSRNMALSNSV
ncbi:MAG: hypothetical protein R2932_59600 [Caldilineaceae bacterium]